MVAQEFFNLFNQLQPIRSVGVEDFADRFNFLFTVIVLLLCTSVVTVKQYLLRPISCYIASPSMGLNLISYVENFCWIHGTNPFKMTSRIPSGHQKWKELDGQKVYYYQWVPFVLGLQCILFYLPRIVWQMMTYTRSGSDVSNLVTLALQADHTQATDREKLVQHVARSLELMLFHYREHRRGLLAGARRTLHRICCGLSVSKRLGSWLVAWYLLVKLLYLANAVGQVYLMQTFLGLGTNYTYFGLDIARDIVAGRDWQQTLVFPRVTFCRVKLKHLGDTGAVVAQCVLPVNMLNEKIYVFLWFWMLLAVGMTGLSIPLWLLRIAHSRNNARFVRKYLKLAERLTKKDKPLVDKFVLRFLRHDGVFLLRMMSLNAGDVVTAEIVNKLWGIYRDRYKHRDFRSDGRREDAGSIRLETNLAEPNIQCVPSAPEHQPTGSAAAAGDVKLMLG